MEENKTNPVENLIEIYNKALETTDLSYLINKSVTLEENILKISGKTFPLDKYRKIFLAGVGTSALNIAKSFEELLGDKLSQGVIMVPPGYGGTLNKVVVKEVTSPLMDPSSKRILRDLFFLLGSAEEEDLIILILTKGTSEILESLPDTVPVADYNTLLKALRAVGARQEEITAIKMHLSQLKGGQIAYITHPATLIALVISDEPGGDLWQTYQGPTYPDPKTFEYCRRILIRYRLPMKLTPAVLNHFNLGMRGKIPETLKRNDPRLAKVHNFLIQDSSSLAADALSAAEKRGFNCSILSTRLDGSALQLGKFFGCIMKDIAEFGIPLEPPCVFIASGKARGLETSPLEGLCSTALSCASLIEGVSNAYLLAGNSFHFEEEGFSGCIISGDTITKLREGGMESADFIRMGKSHAVLKELEMLVPGKFNPVDCGELFIMMVT